MDMIDLNGFNPLPSDIQGWQSDSPIFRNLITEVKPKIIIEVGVWKGASTIHMLKICRELGLDTKIYCIDTWLGAIEFYTRQNSDRNLNLKHGYPQIYYQFISNIINEGFINSVIPIPLPSNVAWQLVPDADLIYIDGSHEYEDVKNDIVTYKKKLKQGGVIFGDDYGNDEFPGVKQAVLELTKPIIINKWHWMEKHM